MDRLMAKTNVNIDAIRVHSETWTQQIREAMLVKGGDIANAACSDYILHFFSFFWKVKYQHYIKYGCSDLFFCSQEGWILMNDISNKKKFSG